MDSPSGLFVAVVFLAKLAHAQSGDCSSCALLVFSFLFFFYSFNKFPKHVLFSALVLLQSTTRVWFIGIEDRIEHVSICELLFHGRRKRAFMFLRIPTVCAKTLSSRKYNSTDIVRSIGVSQRSLLKSILTFYFHL